MPEFLAGDAPGVNTFGSRRRRGYIARYDTEQVALDAGEYTGHRRIIERTRGGQKVTREVAGEVADGGGGGRRRCRGSGARGDKLALRGGAPESEGHACVLEEARSDVDWPELLGELAGDRGGVERN